MYIKQCSTRLNRCRRRHRRSWKRFHEQRLRRARSLRLGDGARLLFIILLAYSHILSAIRGIVYLLPELVGAWKLVGHTTIPRPTLLLALSLLAAQSDEIKSINRAGPPFIAH